MKGSKKGVFSEFLLSPSLGSGSVKGGHFSVTIGGQFSMTFDTRRVTALGVNPKSHPEWAGVHDVRGLGWDERNANRMKRAHTLSTVMTRSTSTIEGIC